MSRVRRFEWRHKGWFARAFDLVEGGSVVATLRQHRLGFDAGLYLGQRRWEADVSGVMRWTIRIVDDVGKERATLPLGWRGQGTIVLGDGRRYAWDADSWSGARWRLTDGAGVDVARVKLDKFLRMDGHVDVEQPTALSDDDLMALLAASWFALVVTTQAAVVSGG